MGTPTTGVWRGWWLRAHTSCVVHAGWSTLPPALPGWWLQLHHTPRNRPCARVKQ